MSSTKSSPAKASEKATEKEVANNNPTESAKKISTSRVDEILNPTADGRIKKLENFKMLADKHRFLIAKQDQLEKFIISSDGTKEKVLLKNASGFEFEVSASQVVEKVLYVIQEELKTFVSISETEVLEYSI